MIIVGIEGCKKCHIYKDLHPEYKYIELKREIKASTFEILEIKKALKNLGFDFLFPVLLNDDLTELTSCKILEKEILKSRACSSIG